MEQRELTTEDIKEQVFDKLVSLGAGKVVVRYHGGGDEGHVEEIEGYTFGPMPQGDLGYGDIEIPWGYGLPHGDEDMEEALCQPIYDAFGHSFGDGEGVDGEVIWNVVDRRVVHHKSWEAWQSDTVEH